MELEDRAYTMYILCINPSVNYESSSETRGAEGILSTPTQPHFRLVDLKVQLQDSPVRAALGFLIPVDLLAVPLVSPGRHRGRDQMSPHAAKILRAPSSPKSSGPAVTDVEVSPCAAGGLLERRFASFAREQCGPDK